MGHYNLLGFLFPLAGTVVLEAEAWPRRHMFQHQLSIWPLSELETLLLQDFTEAWSSYNSPECSQMI